MLIAHSSRARGLDQKVVGAGDGWTSAAMRTTRAPSLAWRRWRRTRDRALCVACAPSAARCSLLETANSWPLSWVGSTLEVSMFVVPDTMPVSVLRCATCLSVNGTTRMSRSSKLCEHNSYLLVNPVPASRARILPISMLPCCLTFNVCFTVIATKNIGRAKFNFSIVK